MEELDFTLEIITETKSRVVVGNDAKAMRGLLDVWDKACGGHDNFNEIARRIVAAWNYCAGIPTEALENEKQL